jgi:hypothetical protein
MRSKFWFENLKERDHLKDVGVDGKIILEWIQGNRVGSGNWIHLAQDRDQWQILLDILMNPQFSRNGGNFLAS